LLIGDCRLLIVGAENRNSKIETRLHWVAAVFFPSFEFLVSSFEYRQSSIENWQFQEVGYFVNSPSKFIGKYARSAWPCYAASFTNGYLHTNYRDDPPGGGYGTTLQEMRPLGPSGKANPGQR